MKRTYIILLILVLNMVVVSCSKEDDVVLSVNPVTCNLFLNVGHQNSMRMANAIVQTEGEPFRGLEYLLVVPFQTAGAVAVTDTDWPLISPVEGSSVDRVSDKFLFYKEKCQMVVGTNRVLAYARAVPVSGGANNGALVTNQRDRMMLDEMTFSLQSIREETTIHDDAKKLADYMTAIATTAGWSTSSDSQMKGLYLDFIHVDKEGTGLMGGSAAQINAHVKELSTQLTAIKDAAGSSDAVKTLCSDIISVIDGEKKDCLDNGYPGSLGLPDGAAVLRWTGSQFEVRTKTTTLDNINGIDRYTYPAELWYYVNSEILTSDNEVAKTDYADAETWTSLLFNQYKSGRSVLSTTKSVAVKDPLQYGVAQLQMTLKTITDVLHDSKGNEVVYGDASKLPLTGVIIGGQHTVGFDFTPKGPKSDVDGRFIYDPIISNEVTEGTDAGDKTINTLVLQSYDGEKVPVVLEFVNKTGNRFYGKDGVIYPYTKFYLIGELNPAGKGTGDYAGRVFTQDHTTSVTMKVNSLANAYSCMPDLLEARLEIGVQIVKQWIQSTTTTVKL